MGLEALEMSVSPVVKRFETSAGSGDGDVDLYAGLSLAELLCDGLGDREDGRGSVDLDGAAQRVHRGFFLTSPS